MGTGILLRLGLAGAGRPPRLPERTIGDQGRHSKCLSRRLTTDKRYLCAIHLINNQAWIAVVYDCLSLNVLAYNMKRVMRIIGTEGLLKAMAA